MLEINLWATFYPTSNPNFNRNKMIQNACIYYTCRQVKKTIPLLAVCCFFVYVKIDIIEGI